MSEYELMTQAEEIGQILSGAIAKRDAEIARLREELADAGSTIAATALDLATERAAHEATKAALEKANQNFVEQHRNAVIPAINRADAAEQRVAELERKHGGDGPGSHAADVLALRAAHAALSSARELLADDDAIAEDQSWIIRRNEWLRANPEPAAPGGGHR